MTLACAGLVLLSFAVVVVLAFVCVGVGRFLGLTSHGNVEIDLRDHVPPVADPERVKK